MGSETKRAAEWSVNLQGIYVASGVLYSKRSVLYCATQWGIGKAANLDQ